MNVKWYVSTKAVITDEGVLRRVWVTLQRGVDVVSVIVQ